MDGIETRGRTKRPGRRGARVRTLMGTVCIGAASALSVVGLAGQPAMAASRHAGRNPLHLVTPGSLTVVAQSDQLPFDGIQNNREVGFDISLDRQIAAQMKLKITFHDQQFPGILPALSAHEYDFGAMALLATPLRAQEVSFSEPFYYGGFSVLVRKGSGLTKASDFAGKRIGVLLGTNQGSSAQQYLGSSIQLVTFENENEVIGALEGGQIDGVFIGYASDGVYLNQYKNLTVPLFWLVSTPNDIPVAKGNTKLVAALNHALNVLFRNGTYAKLYHQWIPGPISQVLVKAHPGFKGYGSSK